MTDKTPSAIDLVERVARAILTERLGAEAARRCEEGDSTAWKDAKRYARAAIETSGLADTITRLKAALKSIADKADELVADPYTAQRGLWKGCSDQAREALRSSAGGE